MGNLVRQQFSDRKLVTIKGYSQILKWTPCPSLVDLPFLTNSWNFPEFRTALIPLTFQCHIFRVSEGIPLVPPSGFSPAPSLPCFMNWARLFCTNFVSLLFVDDATSFFSSS